MLLSFFLAFPSTLWEYLGNSSWPALCPVSQSRGVINDFGVFPPMTQHGKRVEQKLSEICWKNDPRDSGAEGREKLWSQIAQSWSLLERPCLKVGVLAKWSSRCHHPQDNEHILCFCVQFLIILLFYSKESVYLWMGILHTSHLFYLIIGSLLSCSLACGSLLCVLVCPSFQIKLTSVLHLMHISHLFCLRECLKSKITIPYL